jgi:hypothetical protein
MSGVARNYLFGSLHAPPLPRRPPKMIRRGMFAPLPRTFHRARQTRADEAAKARYDNTEGERPQR